MVVEPFTTCSLPISLKVDLIRYKWQYRKSAVQSGPFCEISSQTVDISLSPNYIYGMLQLHQYWAAKDDPHTVVRSRMPLLHYVLDPSPCASWLSSNTIMLGLVPRLSLVWKHKISCISRWPLLSWWQFNAFAIHDIYMIHDTYVHPLESELYIIYTGW